MKNLLFFTILLLCSYTLPAQDDLIAYYPFNSNANDESGNGYNGTVNGATLAADRNGTVNSAYYFDGSSYITISADDAVLNVNTSDFTFSFWVKPDKGQAASSAPIISYGYDRNGGYNVAYWEDYGMFRTSFFDYSWSGMYVAKDEFDYYDWYMYTFTYNGTTLKEYINGVFINEQAGSYYPTTPTGTYTLKFGAESSSNSSFFKGYIDDVRIYHRTLTDLEIAELSGIPGAIKATELNAYSLADFEQGKLDPIKFSNFWAIWGASLDPISYIKVVDNPVKSGFNTSEKVGVSVTFPSDMSWTVPVDCKKKEYVLTTADGLLDDHHHIMRWKILFPDSTLLKIDTIAGHWMSFNQIHGGCQLYDGGACENGGSIAYGGGIFNDNVKASNTDKSKYWFRYRAMPDSARVPYQVDIGKWMSFTYEIYWTHSNTGYWRLWKDGELLSSVDNVKTLPDCCGTDDNFLQFKTGLYNKWNDAVIDSLPLYFDDVELYVGENINIEAICPECFGATAIQDKTFETEQINLFPNPVKDILTIEGEITPSSVTIYSLDGKQVEYIENRKVIDVSCLIKGVYVAKIKMRDAVVVKKFIKE